MGKTQRTKIGSSAALNVGTQLRAISPELVVIKFPCGSVRGLNERGKERKRETKQGREVIEAFHLHQHSSNHRAIPASCGTHKSSIGAQNLQHCRCERTAVECRQTCEGHTPHAAWNRGKEEGCNVAALLVDIMNEEGCAVCGPRNHGFQGVIAQDELHFLQKAELFGIIRG